MDLPKRRFLATGWAPYDALLGADGVNSAVRRALAARVRCDAVDLPGQFKAPQGWLVADGARYGWGPARPSWTQRRSMP